MFRLVLSMSISAILLAGLGGCAKESSKEDKHREEVQRQFERAQKAAGSYKGFVTIADGALVPLALDLVATRNPTDGSDNPVLTGSMRIGLFGGVVISSEAASYDSGNGNLAVTFKREAGAALELRGTLQNGQVVGGVLDGPNLGAHPVTLGADGRDLFSDQNLYLYNAEVDDKPIDGKIAPNAQLSIKRLTKPRTAPATSDLPLLPPLDATLRFVDLGIVPQTVSDVQYDPLTGVVDLKFRDNSRIQIDGVYLAPDGANLGLNDWKPTADADGTVVVGATNYGSIRVSGGFPGLGLEGDNPIAELPPHYYVGTYKGSNDSTARPLRALASLEYTNSQGVNSAEYPFAAFPALRLKLLLCTADVKIADMTYDLGALDQVNKQARFGIVTNTPGGGTGPGSLLLNVSYDADDWSTLIGKVSNANNSTVSGGEPQLQLSAVNSLSSLDCSAQVNATHALAHIPAEARRSSGNSLLFTGYIDRGNDLAVPGAVQILPRNTPNGASDGSSLLVNLSTGFFGALTVGSDEASFDWVSGEITATYHRAAGAGLQLKFLIGDTSLLHATITGPNTGTSTLTMANDGPNFFDNSADSRFTFQFNGGNNTALAGGLLDIKRLDSDLTAPANIDLPSVPGLQVSLSFKSMGQSPQVARAVLYDSLHGTLSMVFGDSTRIDLNHVYLNTHGAVAAPTGLDGVLSVAGAARATVVSNKIADGQAVPAVGQLPPPTYRGTYTTPGGRVWDAVASIDYLGHEAQNTAEFAFASYPALRLRLVYCDSSGQQLGNRLMELSSYDHLTGSSLFKLPAGNGGQGGDLQLNTVDWNTLTGLFTISGGSGGSTAQPSKVSLTAAPLGASGCVPAR